ncbi:uncharacterized protein BYT42DRAFT_648341 [Radiomyces spectabilis]|uniref:uncharacterized protein n=1 Tax=Radiomyces spectabilis TaxID=64574 RepID=UPI00221F275B|nr:uncharacterized protein BYT42DRAFT_648341 [Radiomyces spectabilis]KAI8368148.1 hypothetical protein BYT42DRAFT_648341 [Radiomyces spectabilis]
MNSWAKQCLVSNLQIIESRTFPTFLRQQHAAVQLRRNLCIATHKITPRSLDHSPCQSLILSRSAASNAQPHCYTNTRSFSSSSKKIVADDQKQKPKKRQTWSRRKFVNIEAAETRPNKHLYTMPRDAYGASDRVKELLRVSKLSDSIEFVNCLPARLQSTVVWNQLLGYCAQHGRSTAAKTIFAKMRKHGLEPTDTTLTYMISTFGKSTSADAVAQAEAWFNSIKFYGMEPSPYHVTALLQVYQKAHDNNKALNLIDEILGDGSYPADAATYTTAFQVCGALKEDRAIQYVRNLWSKLMKQQPHYLQQTQLSGLALKAAYISEQEDALKVKAQQENLKIDNGIVVSFLNALGRTARTKEDVWFGVDAIDRLYFLRVPEGNKLARRFGQDVRQDRPATMTPLVDSPNVAALNAILIFCMYRRQYEMGDQYYHAFFKRFPHLQPDDRLDSLHQRIKDELERVEKQKA